MTIKNPVYPGFLLFFLAHLWNMFFNFLPVYWFICSFVVHI